MNKKQKKGLSLEDTIKLMGAERLEEVGQVSFDPIGLAALATRVGTQLTRRRGRPTDKSWEMSRKVPMKQETWEEFKRISESCLVNDNVRISPGQLAAIALERGLHTLRKDVELDFRRLLSSDSNQQETEPSSTPKYVAEDKASYMTKSSDDDLVQERTSDLAGLFPALAKRGILGELNNWRTKASEIKRVFPLAA